jgi:glutathione S-transferase
LEHKALEYRVMATSFAGISSIAGGGQKTVPVMEISDAGVGRVVGDSWDIANDLENTYPDRPSLFGDAQGRAFAFFIQNWCLHALHKPMMKAIILDVYDRIPPDEQENFRKVREQRLGMTLEEIAAGPIDERIAAVRAALEPARAVLQTQPFLSGDVPRHVDYILAGQLHWPREVTPARILEVGDPIVPWFERMLALYDRIGADSTRTWDGP